MKFIQISKDYECHIFDFTFINDYDIHFQRSKSNIYILFVFWYLNGWYFFNLSCWFLVYSKSLKKYCRQKYTKFILKMYHLLKFNIYNQSLISYEIPLMEEFSRVKTLYSICILCPYLGNFTLLLILFMKKNYEEKKTIYEFITYKELCNQRETIQQRLILSKIYLSHLRKFYWLFRFIKSGYGHRD